jgi:hypothetical protein
MTTKEREQFITQRGELMAELLLQELKPRFIAHGGFDSESFDFLVGIPNEAGGVNSFAVEVKSTEQPVEDNLRVSREVFERFTQSNIPVLLLVVDVKQNTISYALVGSNADVVAGTRIVEIPIKRVDGASKRKIQQQLSRLGA